MRGGCTGQYICRFVLWAALPRSRVGDLFQKAGVEQGEEAEVAVVTGEGWGNHYRNPQGKAFPASLAKSQGHC